ncbi:PilZ domain-containing protein, partial [Nitrospiraceae bacterium AH_259_D15_M11_P09]|nr:PilZ domain-containing protein [Nitrospiraceae bacterium AH_259_D15_M11_P09]
MERRRSPRFPVEFTLDFIAHQGTMGVGMASDLSKGGCTVEGNLMVHEGWNLELHLLLPGHASMLKVERGAVRWSRGRRFGVEFLRMGDEEQAR